MKRIVWITADCFVDVDMALVPYLRKEYNFHIDWYVIKGYGSKVNTDVEGVTKMFALQHRQRHFHTIQEYKNIFTEIRVKDACLIYSDFIGFPYYYPVLWTLKRKKQPVIHAAHNVIPYPVWPMGLRVAVKTIFHRNNYFQLFSKHTYSWFKEHYPQKSSFYAPMVVKSFGEVRTDNYDVDSAKVNLLFFGNVRAIKRLDLLIDAIKGLPENIREKVHLNICGNCPVDREKYELQIDGCSAISTYFQNIPDEEIPELFTKHQFFVLPYQDVAQSGPHMISYAYNLPVIASDIDGFSERIEDRKNGFLFKVNDKQSLVDTITAAVQFSNAEYSAMKNNLAGYVRENFSLSAVAGLYVEYFKGISKEC